MRCGDYRVDAEVFKWQTLEMLLEADVKLRLHTLLRNWIMIFPTGVLCQKLSKDYWSLVEEYI